MLELGSTGFTCSTADRRPAPEVDPWGNRYRLEWCDPPAQWIVACCGPDHAADTDDDVTLVWLWQAGIWRIEGNATRWIEQGCDTTAAHPVEPSPTSARGSPSGR